MHHTLGVKRHGDVCHINPKLKLLSFLNQLVQLTLIFKCFSPLVPALSFLGFAVYSTIVTGCTLLFAFTFSTDLRSYQKSTY